MSRPDGTSRRRFLAGAAGLVGGGLVSVTARDLLVAPAGAAAPMPSIKPRSAWAGSLAPKGPLEPERDVKFLLVHHTAGANGYPQAAVPSTLRGIFEYHTGAKGWKDVAYNFFVDAYGGIWEGRQGSLDGPVIPDATGGSQGFAQLCCFMGDHQVTPPTAAAQGAMTDLLAWLAGRHGIDLRSGSTVMFVSRGSNLQPVGKKVTTPTIAGHRDMSNTTCPGDACYRLIKGLAATAATKAGAVGNANLTGPSPTGSDPAPTNPTRLEPAAPESSLPPVSPSEIAEDDPPPLPTSWTMPVQITGGVPRPSGGNPSSAGRVLGAAGLGAAAATGGAVLFRRRRTRAATESRWYRSELLNPPGEGASPPPDHHPDRSPEPHPPAEPAPPRQHLYRPDG